MLSIEFMPLSLELFASKVLVKFTRARSDLYQCEEEDKQHGSRTLRNQSCPTSG